MTATAPQRKRLLMTNNCYQGHDSNSSVTRKASLLCMQAQAMKRDQSERALQMLNPTSTVLPRSKPELHFAMRMKLPQIILLP